MRPITYCELCGKARLTLKHGLCDKCLQLCEKYGPDTPITTEGLGRLLDDLGMGENCGEK